MEHPDTGEWVQFGFGCDLLLISIPETYFVFSSYGHEFVINLGGPAIKGYQQWLSCLKCMLWHHHRDSQAISKDFPTAALVVELPYGVFAF